jgi:hypothetical protein
VTVCIDAKVSVESLLIYQNLNNAIPEFYVVYNYQEEVPTSLYPYKFKFDIRVSMPAIGFRSNWIQRNRNSTGNIINRIVFFYKESKNI